MLQTNACTHTLSTLKCGKKTRFRPAKTSELMLWFQALDSRVHIEHAHPQAVNCGPFTPQRVSVLSFALPLWTCVEQVCCPLNQHTLATWPSIHIVCFHACPETSGGNDSHADRTDFWSDCSSTSCRLEAKLERVRCVHSSVASCLRSTGADTLNGTSAQVTISQCCAGLCTTQS